jgi:hypothetical protein
VHTNATLRTGGQLAAAFRTNSPAMASTLAAFTKKWGPGTTFYNVVHKRYLQSTRFAKSATEDA